MASKKAKTVEIKNLGPIVHLKFTTPQPGGVVVLEGGQGVGKSTALRGVSRMLGGKTPDLSAFDGAPRGELAIDEAVLRVTARQHRTTGELEVVGIEGRLNISDLVDPGIIQEDKADSARLKALVSLAGVVAKPEMFHEIAGGAEDYEALAVDDETDDIILLHSRVKRAFEAAARASEQQAEKTRAEYQALRATFEDLDLEAPCDAAELSAAQDEAVAHLSRLTTHNEGAEVVRRVVELSQKKLQDLGERSANPATLRSQATDSMELAAEADRAATKFGEQLKTIRERIKTANETAARYRQEAADLEQRAADAEEGARLRSSLAADAARSIPALFTPLELESAEEAVAAAKQAAEQGAVIRRAREQEAKAETLHRAAKDHAARGVLFRDRAGALDAVISSVLPAGCPLRYENGRLVIATDRGPREFYSDLSHGERWKVAIDFVAPIVNDSKSGGILPLPQEAYEALDDDNKANIAQLAHDNNLIILTARATHGPLTATVIEAGGKSLIGKSESAV